MAIYDLEEPLLQQMIVNNEAQATILTKTKIIDKVHVEMASKCLKNNEMTMTLIQVMVEIRFV